MENSTKKIGINYGVILGVVIILMTVLAYVFDLALFTKWWFGIISFLLMLVISIMAVSKAKKNSSGIFSFKNAFTAYFLTVFIGTLLATIFSILLFSIIDPEAAEVVNDLTVDASREMMESFGAPEAEVDKALAEMGEDNQFSIMNQLKRFVFSLGFYLILGLIIALIFRQKDPNKA